MSSSVSATRRGLNHFLPRLREDKEGEDPLNRMTLENDDDDEPRSRAAVEEEWSITQEGTTFLVLLSRFRMEKCSTVSRLGPKPEALRVIAHDGEIDSGTMGLANKKGERE